MRDKIENLVEELKRHTNDTYDEIDSVDDGCNNLVSEAEALQSQCNDARKYADQANDFADSIGTELDELLDEYDEQKERIEELETELSQVGNTQIVERLKKVEGICRALWLDIEDAQAHKKEDAS